MAMNQDTSTQVGLFKGLVNRGRLVFRLLRDSRVPIYLKMLPAAGVLYVLFPFDFILDLAPFLGQLDDLGVILVSLEMFIGLCPPHVVEEHRAAIEGREFYSAADARKGETIDGEWRVK